MIRDEIQVKSLNSLKDSRILYEKDVPPFGYFILLTMALFLVVLVAWSTQSIKPYIVRGSGTVVSLNKNYIVSAYSGEIMQINVSEGSYVEKGDVILEIKNIELDLQIQQIDKQTTLYEKEKGYLNRLVTSIKDNVNYFSELDTVERPYYHRFEIYQSQISQNTFDSTVYLQYGYTDEQIQEEILKSEGKNYEIYNTALQEIAGQIAEIESEVNSLKIQREALMDGQAEYRVLANANGLVHILDSYKLGTVVQAGASIGSIANENDRYIITAHIAASDMPRTRVGNKAHIEVLGLSQSLYGVITGIVQTIDMDTTIDQNTGDAYFKVQIVPDQFFLSSKEGNRVNISNGMSVETRITYEEITYYDYVMEALGMLVK